MIDPTNPAAVVRPFTDEMAELAAGVPADVHAAHVSDAERLRRYRAASAKLVRAEARLAAEHGGSSHGYWLKWLEAHVLAPGLSRTRVYQLLAFAKFPPG